MAKQKTFTVYAKVTVDTSMTIKAASLEDAVQQVKELCETDFVDILGDCLDGSMKVYGVYEDDA